MLGGGRHPARLQARGERDRGRGDPLRRSRRSRVRWRRSSRPGRATSSTGARSTLTPSPRRFAAVRRPCSRLKAAPRAPISAAEAVGAPPTRFTSPPSWSTITSSGSRSAGGRRIACRRAIRRRPAARLGKLSAKRTTPATRPAPIAAFRPGETRGAGEADDDPLAGQVRDRERARARPRPRAPANRRAPRRGRRRPMARPAEDAQRQAAPARFRSLHAADATAPRRPGRFLALRSIHPPDHHLEKSQECPL